MIGGGRAVLRGEKEPERLARAAGGREVAHHGDERAGGREREFATLEALFRNIVQSLLDTSLSGALPSMPVPDFALPDSLATFGIAPGTRLGVRNLQLDGTPSHWLVDGVFSE